MPCRITRSTELAWGRAGGWSGREVQRVQAMTGANSDYAPSAPWPALRRRAKLLAQLRLFFAARDFLEVETPLLSRDTVVDQHLDPLAVDRGHGAAAHGEGPTYWLQTSPEFGMKRLLAAGATAIYQITRAFRAGERGRLHNPEFTIVEWYRVGDDMQAGMRLLDELAQETLCRGSAKWLTYQDAFRQFAGVDPHTDATARLAETARKLGHQGTPAWPSENRDAWLDWLLITCVEPNLGVDRPTILYDYPASQAALARVRDEHVPLAERFELYVDGVELANGYHELTDPAELIARTERANAARAADGKQCLPASSRLLEAMRHGLPPSTGVALGFDRLVLVALGAVGLDQVMAFTIERA